MKGNRERHAAAKTARESGVSRSGYYAWEKRKPSQHEEEDLKLGVFISKIFKEHRGRYGSPRVWEELKRQGIRTGRKRVERLMREGGLQARRKRKAAYKTDSGHRLETADNILNREFRASFPGEKWVSDITYLRTDKGWLYLTAALDLWDRKVIGWSMSRDMTAGQTCLALDMAVRNRLPREGLIFHSDRGVQYCGGEFRSALKRLCPSVRQSMSRKGNCWDNACAESFFKTLKTELGVLKKGGSVKQVKTAVFEYIEVYYNRCRRHSAIGYAIPIALTPNIAA
jgi:transposase InsO family protein